MNNLPLFLDCLFLTHELISYVISRASDLIVWCANRFHTDSSTCHDGEQKQDVTVHNVLNRAPLFLLPPAPHIPVLQLVVPLSQDLSLNQGAIHIHIRIHKEDENKQDRRRARATQQAYLIVSSSQVSRSHTTDDNLMLTRYRSINTHSKA